MIDIDKCATEFAWFVAENPKICRMRNITQSCHQRVSDEEEHAIVPLTHCQWKRAHPCVKPMGNAIISEATG